MTAPSATSPPLHFGIAGQNDGASCGGIGNVVCLTAHRPFAPVQRLAEADGRTFRPHGFAAFAAACDVDARGGNVERTLSDDDIAAKCGTLVGLIERTLVGFDLDG